MRTLSDLPELKGKTVILRCDFNVPLDDDLNITDDGRIRAALPTIQKLLDAGSKLIVISHLGRPEGAPDPQYSLKPVAKRLADLVGTDVSFCPVTVGDQAKAMASDLADGQILLLENLRFNQGETAKDEAARLEFAKELADLAEVFVSDGFGVVHRKQASVYELAKLLPSAAGLLIESELSVLEKLTENPEKPYVVALGGSKVSDKLGVIDHLLPKVDALLIGGGMLFTFLAALGHKVGASLLEEDQIDICKEYLSRAEKLGVRLVLPTDVIIADRFAADANSLEVTVDNIESSAFGQKAIGLDIGPETAAVFAKEISSAKTVFWNGPMGVFEFEKFSQGTRTVATALAQVEGLSVVGGGDSAAAVRALGFADSDFSHISTGGGASLEFLEGKKLPGLEVLN